MPKKEPREFRSIFETSSKAKSTHIVSAHGEDETVDKYKEKSNKELIKEIKSLENNLENRKSSFEL